MKDYRFQFKCSKKVSPDCEKIILSNFQTSVKNRTCFPCGQFIKRAYSRKYQDTLKKEKKTSKVVSLSRFEKFDKSKYPTHKEPIMPKFKEAYRIIKPSDI
jgi:hypothetical protein